MTGVIVVRGTGIQAVSSFPYLVGLSLGVPNGAHHLAVGSTANLILAGIAMRARRTAAVRHEEQQLLR
jgi:Na+/H+ antiporter NhaD/arsenite permease-like protein